MISRRHGRGAYGTSSGQDEIAARWGNACIKIPNLTWLKDGNVRSVGIDIHVHVEECHSTPQFVWIVDHPSPTQVVHNKGSEVTLFFACDNMKFTWRQGAAVDGLFTLGSWMCLYTAFRIAEIGKLRRKAKKDGLLKSLNILRTRESPGEEDQKPERCIEQESVYVVTLTRLVGQMLQYKAKRL